MKLKNWAQLFLLIALISLGLYGSFRKKKFLKECSKKATATIIDKYTINSRGYFIKYTYYADGKEYQSSESIKNKIEIQTFNIGKPIEIEYSCKNPDISKFKKLTTNQK